MINSPGDNEPAVVKLFRFGPLAGTRTVALLPGSAVAAIERLGHQAVPGRKCPLPDRIRQRRQASKRNLNIPRRACPAILILHVAKGEQRWDYETAAGAGHCRRGIENN